MAKHVRTQIRHGIAALLKDLATTGPRVYPSRVFSLDESELPSISVYTTDEANEEAISNITLGAPARLHRSLPLIIEGHALVDDNVDDMLDQIALDVEQAMAAPFMIEAKEIPVRLVSSQNILSGDGELQVGVLRMVYSIAYSTFETTPDSIL